MTLLRDYFNIGSTGGGSGGIVDGGSPSSTYTGAAVIDFGGVT